MHLRPSFRLRPQAVIAIVAMLALIATTLPFSTSPAAAAVPTTVLPESGVVLVDPGDLAQVGLVLTTTGGVETDEDITIAYEALGTLVIGTGGNQRTIPDTAVAGVDYDLGPGEFVVPAGTPSGSLVTFPVQTFRPTEADVAKWVTLRLTSPTPGVTITANRPISLVINAHGLPYLDPTLPTPERVEDLLARMTIEEKAGQMTQPERPRFQIAASNNNSSVELIASFMIGSVLSGGGSVPTPNTPEGWSNMFDSYQSRALRTRLQIPLIYGVDSVHGHQLLYGSTIFPHNIGLGATNDPDLVEETGRLTAIETRTTGPQWTFAPSICVGRNIRWGRTYECFSEDPARVSAMTSIIDGYQGADGSLGETERLLATPKHFAGDGGTTGGIDQGVYEGSYEEFLRLHVTPYLAALQRDIGSIMPSFSSVDFTDDDEGPRKMHGHDELLTDLLKDELGFGGFLISDWNGIYQLPGNNYQDIADAFNAGIDMNMVPSDYRNFIRDMILHAQAGTIPMERIDDALRRILTQKFELGLFEQPFTDRSNHDTIGSPEHRAVARDAAAASQVLLKNEGDLLPLPKDGSIYLAGRSANNLGNLTGGWTITWQGVSGNTHTIGTNVYQAIQEVAPDADITLSPTASAPTDGHDVGIVVVGETPYAEGQGDRRPGTTGNLNLVAQDRTAVDTVCNAMPCVVVVVSGRPMTITDQLPIMDALVAAWLPGTEGTGVVDVLFGDRPYAGRLPVTWPAALEQEPINVGDETYDPLYPYGWGLRTDASRERLQQLRDSLAGIRNDGQARAAQAHLDKLLRTSGNWYADGSVRNEAEVLFWLSRIAIELDRSMADTFADGNLLVSVARDIAQRAILAGHDGVPDDAYALTADAEHALWSGELAHAISLLARAAGHG
jgi:beta-glucosidase